MRKYVAEHPVTIIFGTFTPVWVSAIYAWA